MSPSVLKKAILNRRFSNARSTYDQHAVVQTRMASHLLAAVQHQAGGVFPRVLEIGCGTGLLTRRLLASCRIDHFYANDLVKECNPRQFLPPQCAFRFFPGDAEDISDFPSGLHLVIANAVFQWIQAWDSFLRKLNDLLLPGGWLAFSSFGPDNFTELKQVLGLTLPYASLNGLIRSAAAHFTVVHAEESREILCFSGAAAVFQHMQAIGVNSLPSHLWTKSFYQNALARYQKHCTTAAGTSLTYHPLHLVLRKKPPCP
ncbi:methyltransferase domain-containing protein [candidate division FCPU426 bacterium]|nr:methyltransferase domain-containing protein [candidate division FCPU426 bacterium]